MKLRLKLVAGLAALAVAAVPSVAGAAGPERCADRARSLQGPEQEARQGQKGTPFSTCVKGVAQMRKDKAEEEAES